MWDRFEPLFRKILGYSIFRGFTRPLAGIFVETAGPLRPTMSAPSAAPRGQPEPAPHWSAQTPTRPALKSDSLPVGGLVTLTSGSGAFVGDAARRRLMGGYFVSGSPGWRWRGRTFAGLRTEYVGLSVSSVLHSRSR